MLRFGGPSVGRSDGPLVAFDSRLIDSLFRCDSLAALAGPDFILAGDFNCVGCPSLDVIGSDGRLGFREGSLLSVCFSLGFVVRDWRFSYRDSVVASWSGATCATRVDLVLHRAGPSSPLLPSQALVAFRLDFPSDHSLVAASFSPSVGGGPVPCAGGPSRLSWRRFLSRAPAELASLSRPGSPPLSGFPLSRESVDLIVSLRLCLLKASGAAAQRDFTRGRQLAGSVLGGAQSCVLEIVSNLLASWGPRPNRPPICGDVASWGFVGLWSPGSSKSDLQIVLARPNRISWLRGAS